MNIQTAWRTIGRITGYCLQLAVAYVGLIAAIALFEIMVA